jgi:hypothetical protein
MASRVLKLYHLLIQPRSRYVLSWLVAAAAVGITLFCSWTVFDTPRKADGLPRRRGGNKGHTMIDFGCQWLMGRMLVLGQGEHLYDRNYLRPVLVEGYPYEDEIPLEERGDDELNQHDADDLMTWLMGRDDPETARAVGSLAAPLAAPDPLAAAVLARAEADGLEARVQTATTPHLGGALYPPIHGLVMYPLGLLRPSPAYRIVQVLSILLAVAAGWGIRLLSQGRIWWPVAIAAIVLFPGFSSCLNLAQNSILMLTLLIWGWVALARGRPVTGGSLWGLLAFKPTWAMAFFLVPLLSGRWRFCLAMLATGAGLALATLPLVGVQTWRDWLQVGREASALYNTDSNWVFLSRDLQDIPRRWLLDFPPEGAHDTLAATVAGWALLLAVLGTTAAVVLCRREPRRAITGYPAAFLLLGGWLCCFHFMFYDVVLAALPVLLLLTEPRRYLEPAFLAIVPVSQAELAPRLAAYYRPEPAAALPTAIFFSATGARHVYVRNSLTLTLIVLLAFADLTLPVLKIAVSMSAPALEHGPVPLPLKFSTAVAGIPGSTFCLLALWLWCGWLTWRAPTEAASPPTPPQDPVASPLLVPVDAAQLV